MDECQYLGISCHGPGGCLDPAREEAVMTARAYDGAWIDYAMPDGRTVTVYADGASATWPAPVPSDGRTWA